MLPSTKLSYLPVLIALGFAAHNAHASGYHFGTQSVSAQSTANASAAEAADASTLFYNAAGLTKLDGTQVSVNVNLVAPSIKYHNAQATYPTGNPPQVQGQTSGTITPDVVVAPHTYLSHKINDRLTAGFGIYVPFGSRTAYDDHSVLRYNINQMELMSIDLNPTLAIKATENHSFAVGVIGQYTHAKLRQYANFGSLIGVNGAVDGYADVKGQDWGFGYNLSWLWDVTPDARIGLNYRSKIKHTLEGSAQWKLANDNPIIQAGIDHEGYKSYEKAKLDIETPESLSLHGMYKVNSQWNLFGDITWTRHSQFDKAIIEFEHDKTVAGGRSNKTTLTPNWKNTFKYAVGASYQITDPLQLRFGVAYDQSPASSSDRRLTTLPDNDRFWLSLGGKYDLNKNSSIGLAYSYIFIKDSDVNVNGYCGGSTPASVACVSSKTKGTAQYKNHAQILGLQFNHKF